LDAVNINCKFDLRLIELNVMQISRSEMISIRGPMSIFPKFNDHRELHLSRESSVVRLLILQSLGLRTYELGGAYKMELSQLVIPIYGPYAQPVGYPRELKQEVTLTSPLGPTLHPACGT
jgi:hypothetical protein